MKKLFLFFAVVLVAITASLSVQALTFCYCEIGAYPSQQQKYFRSGCYLWLNQQKKCDSKKTVVHDHDYRTDLLNHKNINLKIGYVGHWSGTDETIQYIDQTIIPLIREFSLTTAEIDNTACMALQQPYRVHEFVKSQRLPANSQLTFKGNQVNSIGMWEKILGPSLNLNAVVSTRYDQVAFPRCLIFEGQSCMKNPQANNSGLCIDQNNILKQLTCCEQFVDTGVGDGPNFQKKFIWSDQCHY